MTESPHKTLGQLRAERRFKTQEIIKRALVIDDEFPSTHAGYLKIEARGTRDYWKIKALADVFGVLLEEMAKMLKPKIAQK